MASFRALRARGLAAAALLVTVLTAAPLPAAAATPGPYLLVSHDGVSFERTSTVSLFQGMGRIVPGDTGAESVWVRSQAPAAGDLRVEIIDAWTDDPELSQATTLSVSTGGETQSLRLDDAIAAGGSVPIGPVLTIDPGDTVRLDATMAVDAALGGESGQDGMRGQIGFQMRVTIAGDGVPPTPEPTVDPQPTVSPEPLTRPDGNLPATGVEVRNGLVLGAAVMAAGIVLLMWKRRKKRATGE